MYVPLVFSKTYPMLQCIENAGLDRVVDIGWPDVFHEIRKP